jgi:hypothetical protein
MKCPHCLDNFFDKPVYEHLGGIPDADGHWCVSVRKCPSCNRLVLYLLQSREWKDGPSDILTEQLIRPRGSSRPPCPPGVPEKLAEDYKESCIVLPDSAKESAALSRRCLQHLLRDHTGIKPSNLADEIQQIIDIGKLPSHLAESIDAIRHIGNFSAHPIKSNNTGEIFKVEPQEAEWNLDVLESLFDFYFVQPALLKKKRDALNKKLAEAGKHPMK